MCFVYIHIGCVSLCGGETERDRGQYVREVGRQTLTRPLWAEGGGGVGGGGAAPADR